MQTRSAKNREKEKFLKTTKFILIFILFRGVSRRKCYFYTFYKTILKRDFQCSITTEFFMLSRRKTKKKVSLKKRNSDDHCVSYLEDVRRPARMVKD